VRLDRTESRAAAAASGAPISDPNGRGWSGEANRGVAKGFRDGCRVLSRLDHRGGPSHGGGRFTEEESSLGLPGPLPAKEGHGEGRKRGRARRPRSDFGGMVVRRPATRCMWDALVLVERPITPLRQPNGWRADWTRRGRSLMRLRPLRLRLAQRLTVSTLSKATY
jgi:hypothetical protein